MSKIGKLPVIVKEGVTVALDNNVLTVSGPKGNVKYTLPKGLQVTVADGKITVTQAEQMKEQTKALYGLTRSLIANMVQGVSTGFEKRLELAGVGYRAQMTGVDVTLSVGFSQPVKVQAKPGITFAVKDNGIVVSGIDKALVGNVAAEIRAIRPPEPYKGKGIKYTGERIRRKAGKAAKAVGGK